MLCSVFLPGLSARGRGPGQRHLLPVREQPCPPRATADKSRLEEQRGKLEAQKKELEEQKKKLEAEAAPDAPAEPAEPAEGQQHDAEQGSHEAVDAEAEAAAAQGDAEAEAEAAAAAAEAEGEAAKSEEELARERMAQWIPGSKGGDSGEQEEQPGEEQPGEEALPAYDGEDLAAADAAAALAEQQDAEAGAEEEGDFFRDEHPDGAAAGGAGGVGGGEPAASAVAGAAPGGGAGGQGAPASALGKAKRLLSTLLGVLTGQKAGADVSGPIAELAAQIEKLGEEPGGCAPLRAASAAQHAALCCAMLWDVPGLSGCGPWSAMASCCLLLACSCLAVDAPRRPRRKRGPHHRPAPVAGPRSKRCHPSRDRRAAARSLLVTRRRAVQPVD